MAMSGIGVLNEKPLHAALKEWCARPGDRFEVAVEGFVIAIVRDVLLLEIQAGNFASLKARLKNLVCSHRIRLIYPIAQEKWLVKLAQAQAVRAWIAMRACENCCHRSALSRCLPKSPAVFFSAICSCKPRAIVLSCTLTPFKMPKNIA